MEAINLRQNLIHNINILPSDMLEELNKFLSFLKYRNLSNSDSFQEEFSDDNSLNDYMKTAQFQKDKKRLQSTYADVISGKATLLSEDEYNEKMNDFVADLKIKYADS
jgi:hypothetical protein